MLEMTSFYQGINFKAFLESGKGAIDTSVSQRTNGGVIAQTIHRHGSRA